MSQSSLLLLLFHPDLSRSRANRVLVEAVRGLPGVKVHDVYTASSGNRINVAEEQALLVAHPLIVFQHPFYWYSGPALMKEWMDRVLEQGFAFPPGVGDRLRGKRWLSVVTTGGAEDAYRSGGFNNYTMSELLRPFQQTANLCGMSWLPPFVVHGVLPPGIEGFRNISDEELHRRGEAYRQLLAGLIAEGA
ncbi:MAG: NAD(P)H-dependent oxidoreductase [Magnetococcales bacterium]|nr:NAD(P)H-dependent oxidoreductase [Magnetococcales bacterium]